MSKKSENEPEERVSNDDNLNLERSQSMEESYDQLKCQEDQLDCLEIADLNKLSRDTKPCYSGIKNPEGSENMHDQNMLMDEYSNLENKSI